MRTCPYCAAQIAADDDSVDYGEEWWCSSSCLAKYYDENQASYDRMGLGPESIEAAVHHTIVFDEQVRP